MTAAPDVWINNPLPGGYVCGAPDPGRPDGVCGMPVEDEPCAEHQAVTDLRDQLADFEAAAQRLTRPGDPIPLTRGADIGHLLRDLRHRAGLSQNALARRAHVSKSGLSAREQRSSGLSVGALIEHLDALGYDVVAVPRTRSLRSAA